MTIGDAELLSSTRAGTRPPASVWAVVAAARQITAAGKSLTTEGLGECTGLDRATLYRARGWLDEHLPEWRPEQASPPQANGHKGPRPEEEHAPAEPTGIAIPVEVVGVDEPAPVAIPQRVALAPPSTNGAPCLVWRDVLSRHRDAVTGRRTWDLFVDIYSPAADEVFADGNLGDLIALTLDYVKVVHGGDLTGAERTRIAKIVRMYGKAVIHGMQEAMSRIDSPGLGPAITYGAAVAQATHRKIRHTEAQEATA